MFVFVSGLIGLTPVGAFIALGCLVLSGVSYHVCTRMYFVFCRWIQVCLGCRLLSSAVCTSGVWFSHVGQHVVSRATAVMPPAQPERYGARRDIAGCLLRVPSEQKCVVGG